MMYDRTVHAVRSDRRIILHFDYDCFYAAVFEKERPALKSLPFAVQQKQIIVTCNYKARERGLYKLQTVREAKRVCPEVIIELGEKLDRFRDASRDNYNFLRSLIWGDRADRLGFDEVFLDVTDLVDYNQALLNQYDLPSSFFHLDKNDPTKGFSFDASRICGNVWGTKLDPPAMDDAEDLSIRLLLGSHLAQWIRHELELHQGFTATVGISTNKLLSKLVGNVHKPKRQTTLLPPYHVNLDGASNVQSFIDGHDVGKIPGIGFKTAQKLRTCVLGRPAVFDEGLVYGGSRESVSVGDVRLCDGMSKSRIEKLFDGPGIAKDLPERIWGLLHGIDDAEVGKARDFPHQISIEDSYIKLNDMPAVLHELQTLSASLLARMREDLTAPGDSQIHAEASTTPERHAAPVETGNIVHTRRWIAFPGTLRLSTRPRPPRLPDGTRSRSFARISRSSPMPSFAFNLSADVKTLSVRVVTETLVPLFHRLHPERSGWDLSLVNLCAANITAAANKGGGGMKISHVFGERPEERQVGAVSNSQYGATADTDAMDEQSIRMNMLSTDAYALQGSEDALVSSQEMPSDEDLDGSIYDDYVTCASCGAITPISAATGHDNMHKPLS